MALTAQLSQAWKSRIETYLVKAPVFANALTNNHYEGELKQNATLNVISVGEVTVNPYTGADISFEDLATTGITFTADQKKSFSFRVLDSNQYGSMIKLQNEGSQKAALVMARDVDDYLAGLYTGIITNVVGTDGSPISVGFNTVGGDIRPSVALSMLQQVLAEANADQSDPSIVIPPWLASYLLMEFGIKYSAGGDSASKVGVKIGKLDMPPIAGFGNIFVSNNVAYTAGTPNTLYKVMAGSPNSSITFASGLDTVETGRLEKNFGSFVKGLHIYGAKIPYETHMALGTFNIGTALNS